MATSLAELETRLVDLKQLCVGISRQLRKRDRTPGGPSGDAFVAMAAAAIFGHLKRHDLAATWQTKAAVAPANTTTPGWAAELVSSVTADFVVSLGSNIFAFPSIALRSHSFPLSGNMRAVLAGSALASFVAEGEAIGVAVGEVSAASLRPYSIKVLSTFSEELAERSAPSVEALLRKILGDAVGACLDGTFLGDQAATVRAPAGVLYNLMPVAPGASFAEDVRNLTAALGSPADPIFIVSPARRVGLAASGSLLGFDSLVLSSSSVPDDRIIGLDRDGLIIGFGGQPTFKVSREATLVEQTQDAVGAVVATAPTRSLWQTDAASLKCSLPVSWYVRQGASTFTEPLAW
ncbi:MULTISPECIES: hypothetical protein [unclassified Sinorhizobium]|uniref:hypothetical protein n=1 Tax=unclassified Sinorhizobium TaxID=2613772 RepID=UPI0024C29F5C|nr:MULTISPECIES: hypothetical protein [unclassified Sinorhizobium]MDK1376150.1 hypothetical protein [Sinorhizobium sp. 6-70]MDK1480313.1 hypothetical protein [Sinorhizobium sp. 6-117]